MTEFDEFIKRAQSGGLSFEDIAASFTEAMNKAQMANKSKKERNEWAAAARTKVNNALKIGSWSFEIAALVAGLAAADRYPDYTKEDLEVYIDAVKTALTSTVTLMADFKDGGDKILNDLFSNLGKTKIAFDDDTILRDFVKNL